jgi:hypothetical protein
MLRSSHRSRLSQNAFVSPKNTRKSRHRRTN